MKLSELPLSVTAVIDQICPKSPLCPVLERMGFCRGERICIKRKSPYGGPLECELMGYRIALRPEEAAAVEIRLTSPEENAR